jgi:hypothetical protein
MHNVPTLAHTLRHARTQACMREDSHRKRGMGRGHGQATTWPLGILRQTRYCPMVQWQDGRGPAVLQNLKQYPFTGIREGVWEAF